DPPDAEPIDSERVANRGGVGGAVRDLPALVSRRAAIAGTVVRDETDPTLRSIARMRFVERARSGRARQKENRETVRVAALTNGERAAVRTRHGSHRAILRLTASASHSACHASARAFTDAGALG